MVVALSDSEKMVSSDPNVETEGARGDGAAEETAENRDGEREREERRLVAL